MVTWIKCTTVTYTSIAGEAKYTLIITYMYPVVHGSTYELTIASDESTSTSRGTAAVLHGGAALALSGNGTNAGVTISHGKMTGITGLIETDNGTEEGPGTVVPEQSTPVMIQMIQ